MAGFGVISFKSQLKNQTICVCSIAYEIGDNFWGWNLLKFLLCSWICSQNLQENKDKSKNAPVSNATHCSISITLKRPTSGINFFNIFSRQNFILWWPVHTTSDSQLLLPLHIFEYNPSFHWYFDPVKETNKTLLRFSTEQSYKIWRFSEMTVKLT